MQLRVRHIARNVVFNWLGTLVNMAVGFFLSPFILHRLGTVAYGVWVLAVSAVAYLNLLDLGMQNSVLRFVSKGYTQKDHAGASEMFSAAFWVRLQISALVLVLSLGLAVMFPHVFKVPAELASDARVAILLIAAAAATSMSIGVYGGVLSALSRYDLQNYARLIQTTVRVVGVVLVLTHGRGIIAIAVCELLAAVVGNVLLTVIARRLYPELQLSLARPKWTTLKTVWSYSFYVFITGIAVQLINQTDNIVVGAFISTAAVTFYAIANSLCRYADQIIGSLGTTFVPAASTYEAAGDSNGLLMLYKNGTRATLIISLPVMLTLTLRGSHFISLWMGPSYAHVSGRILALLAFPLLFGYANRTPGAIAFGIEKHKVVALFAVGEGVLNLVLSVILVRRYGIYGVAIGTLVPSLLVHLIFWPHYIYTLVGLSSFQVIRNVWGPVMLAAVPLAAVSWMMEVLSPSCNLLMFLLQVLIALAVFLGALCLIYRGFVFQTVLPKLRSIVLANRATN